MFAYFLSYCFADNKMSDFFFFGCCCTFLPYVIRVLKILFACFDTRKADKPNAIKKLFASFFIRVSRTE